MKKYKVLKNSVFGNKGQVVSLHPRQATFGLTSGFLELQKKPGTKDVVVKDGEAKK